MDFGIIPCLKHFPGHGSALSDTHDGFTDVTSTWRPEELTPYVDAIKNNWPGAIMSAHIYNKNLDGTFPASLSKKVITELLRRDLGWGGVIVTDDLHMGAIAKQYSIEETVYLAINAGADILVFSNNSKDVPYDPNLAKKINDIICGLVNDGRITEGRLLESWRRIMKLKGRNPIANKTAHPSKE